MNEIRDSNSSVNVDETTEEGRVFYNCSGRNCRRGWGWGGGELCNVIDIQISNSKLCESESE